MAFDCCGSELSYRKIAAAIGISVETVLAYLDACEAAYLIFACQYFSFSEQRRQSRPKKYYPIDSGMRYAITNTNNRDIGKSLELMVYIKLRKTNEKVYYWQEIHKGEVDFVVQNGNQITPYQVSWEGAQSRHAIALQNFYEHFPQAAEAVFISQENAADFLN